MDGQLHTDIHISTLLFEGNKMIRRLADDTVLGGFSIFFRVAVFALKTRHILQVSTVGPDAKLL